MNSTFHHMQLVLDEESTTRSIH